MITLECGCEVEELKCPECSATGGCANPFVHGQHKFYGYAFDKRCATHTCPNSLHLALSLVKEMARLDIYPDFIEGYCHGRLMVFNRE